MVDRGTLEQFFAGIMEREEEMREVRSDIKESFAAFASSHEVDLGALKDGFKFHKKSLKDAEDARASEFERDKLVEILIAEDVAVVEN